MNRAQIERAELASEHLANRKWLTETRRTEAQTFDDLLSDAEEAAGVDLRRRVYREQIMRAEDRRQAVVAFLIAEGVLGEVHATVEAPVANRRRHEPSKTVFTAEQLEIARRSLSA
jgi:hypothetical protein